MVEITLLEVHFDDSEFSATASAPFAPGAKEVEAGGKPPADDESGNGAALAALVGLGFLLALAYVAKRRYLDDPDDDGLEEEVDVGT
jgi:hypothetical protein